MLTLKQIKKLARGYTDKQISDEYRGPLTAPGVWTTGIVALYEDYKPKGNMREPKELTAAQLEWLQEEPKKLDTPIYPVELREDRGNTALRFVDAECRELWTDAKYISAMVQPRRVGKKPDITFWTSDNDLEMYQENGNWQAMILVKNGHNVGIVSVRYRPDTEPEWNFRYTGPVPEKK